MRHVQVHDVLRAEFLRGEGPQLPALAVGKHPLRTVRVEHDVDLLPAMHLADVVAPVIQRHQTGRVQPQMNRTFFVSKGTPDTAAFPWLAGIFEATVVAEPDPVLSGKPLSTWRCKAAP
jgi:hypothetical protein